MAEHTYFMYPRIIKSSYLKGWKGHRTMVLGASLPCYIQDCPMKEACRRNSRKFDKDCFAYQRHPERDDLRLSNSNYDEVESFIDGNSATYFSIFTKFMTGKMDEIPLELRGDFWDNVAFYNYDQNIHPVQNDDDSADHVHDTEENFEAFMEALEELKPEVIYVWFTQVRDILVKHHIEGLQEVDQLNMNSITVYRFIYHIQPTPHPKEVLHNFRKGFDTELKDNAEAYLLHALYRAQGYHPTLPYTPLNITEGMIDFAQPYVWDESLYVYLIKTLQKRMKIDMAYDFIHQRWSNADMFCVASNFYCGIQKCIPMHDFTPSELSFFTLTDSEILKVKYAAETQNFQFVYLNEETEKRAVRNLFNIVKNTKNEFKIGLFISIENCTLFEDFLFESGLIGNIHLISHAHKPQMVYVELVNNIPKETINVYRDNVLLYQSSLTELNKRDKGKRLLVREFLEDSEIRDENLEEAIKILYELKWITFAKNSRNYYVINKNLIELPNNTINKGKETISFDGMSKDGLIYLFLAEKTDKKRAKIMTLFPDITKDNEYSDCIREAKKRLENIKTSESKGTRANNTWLVQYVEGLWEKECHN